MARLVQIVMDEARAKCHFHAYGLCRTLYLEALEQLAVTAQEAVAFEDSPNGVLAAKAAGVFCVAVPNEVTRDLGLEEAGADIVLDSLADLPPETLFSRVEEG